MLSIKQFTFNPFQENTYLLYGHNRDAVIIDPGCSNASENEEIRQFIDNEKLVLKRLLNTHCHVDHIMGNDYIFRTYDLKPEIHRLDLQILKSSSQYGELFGINVIPSPEPHQFLDEGDAIEFDGIKLDVVHVPGHAPGHVVFICEVEKVIIGGDVLFLGSIGRTDLPGGNHELLIRSIREKLFALDGDYRVFPGHGPSTTIGYEKKNNPFFKTTA